MVEDLSSVVPLRAKEKKKGIAALAARLGIVLRPLRSGDYKNLSRRSSRAVEKFSCGNYALVGTKIYKKYY
jgi:hypothetical protein